MSAVTTRSRIFRAMSVAFVLVQVGSAQGNRPVAEIRGHATFQSGVVASPVDHITINAWLDEAGVAHGSVAWRSACHGIMPSASNAYPWHMAVTNLLIMGNQAFIEAFVVESPQAPQDAGIPAFITVVDHGVGSLPNDEISVYLGPLGSVSTGDFKVRSDVQTGPPGCEVRGHGTWTQTVGVPEGGQFTDQININAWLDSAGNPQGMMVWTGVFHQVPGNPVSGPGPGPGPGTSGYPWYIDVTALSMSGNVASIQGIVVHSPQLPADEGVSVSFTVEDLGNGGSTPFDRLSGFEILGGNFTVTSSCTLPLTPYWCDMDLDGAWATYYYPGLPPPGSSCTTGGGPPPNYSEDCDDTWAQIQTGC